MGCLCNLLRAYHFLAKGNPDTNKCYKRNTLETISVNYRAVRLKPEGLLDHRQGCSEAKTP